MKHVAVPDISTSEAGYVRYNCSCGSYWDMDISATEADLDRAMQEHLTIKENPPRDRSTPT